jgi:hypothetical protein
MIKRDMVATLSATVIGVASTHRDPCYKNDTMQDETGPLINIDSRSVVHGTNTALWLGVCP